MNHRPHRRAASLARAVSALLLAVPLQAAPSPQQPPDPEITIALRGAAGGAIAAGQPFVVAVRIESPDGVATPIRLAPAKGSWADAILVELVDADGKLAATATAVGAPPAAAAILDDHDLAEGLLLFTASATSALRPGGYCVRARLQITDGAGWHGTVAAEPIALAIDTGSESPARRTQRALALAIEALLTGSPQRSAEILDAELGRRPDEQPLLVMRAQLSIDAHDLAAARVCLARAQELESRRGVVHPSPGLQELGLRLASAESAPVALPPGWTKLPAAVVTPLPAVAPAPEAPPAPVPGPTPVAAIPAPPPASPVSAKQQVGSLVAAAELTDAKVAQDADGQWAATATAGSQYGKVGYSAAKATGAPDVPVVGNSPDAWCPANKNKGTDWLELTFATPAHAVEVRIRQNDTVGAIAKVEAIEPDGTVHVWWEGVDPYQRSAVREIVWFTVRVPRTDYLVAKVKVSLDLTVVTGWKEIDAVQLVGRPD